jgi:putative transposase
MKTLPTGIDKVRRITLEDQVRSASTRLPSRDPLSRGYRFPAAIISHAVWLYYRFALSHRDVEELLAERGVQVSDEAIRRWCQKFGAAFVAGLRRRRARAADTWHLDEVQLQIKGKQHWQWRAVDQDGMVLDLLVQERRNQEASEAFLRRLVEGQGYRPRVVITDTLASYPPALRRVLPGVEHRRHKGLNNRAENSHRPTRRRERVLQRFKSPAHAQPFLAPFGPISDHFRPRRHLLPAPTYHQTLQTRFAIWREVTGLAASYATGTAVQHASARQAPLSTLLKGHFKTCLRPP